MCSLGDAVNATGNEVLLKLENLRMTGSFKDRGALNRILTLTDEEKKRGVIAASAGNHAQAVAYHATRHGIRSCTARISMRRRPRHDAVVKRSSCIFSTPSMTMP